MKHEIDQAALNRFREKYAIDEESDCWLWKASTNGKNGYGKMFAEGKLKLAHVFAYENFKGEIPKGLTIDHQCNNRKCVNPDHLEVATQKENNLRGNSPAGINSRKTICINGHDLFGDNVKIVHQKDGIRRKCKQCQPIYKRRSRIRMKNERAALPAEPAPAKTDGWVSVKDKLPVYRGAEVGGHVHDLLLFSPDLGQLTGCLHDGIFVNSWNHKEVSGITHWKSLGANPAPLNRGPVETANFIRQHDAGTGEV